jgi:putative ABC transport system permease protein
MVLRQGMVLVLAGLAVGLAGALVLAPLLTTLLYAVTPRDPATFLGVTAVLLGVTAVACFVPARRATAIDPIQALRSD